ncbi:MAG: hypothetical protein IKM77_06825 [Prevotella sp.]|nr:hypothetical protein [Prevotella sp.]
MQKVLFGMLTAILICGLNVFSSCIGSDNPVSPANPASSQKIVGNWFSDVSGMTFAKWNYGKTWQNTEFKTDGTGATRIYYLIGDNAVACEKIDFTYKASTDGMPLIPCSTCQASTRFSRLVQPVV